MEFLWSVDAAVDRSRKVHVISNDLVRPIGKSHAYGHLYPQLNNIVWHLILDLAHETTLRDVVAITNPTTNAGHILLYQYELKV